MLLDRKVIKNYTHALFKCAVESSQEKKVFAEISIFAEIMQQLDIVKRVMCSPIVDRSIKSNLIDLIADKYKFVETSKQFLYVLIKNERAVLIPEISAEFAELLMASDGIKSVEVTSAFKLSDAEIKSIKHFLESELDKKIELSSSVDPSMIGGAVIKYDSNLIDCSVQGALDRIEKVAIRSKI